MIEISLGCCCICEKQDVTVRNLMTLHLRLPETETNGGWGGWGCFVCDLEPKGAVAVLCDDCLERMVAKTVEIKFACLGYPKDNRRIALEKLTENWEHDLSKHPEQWNWDAALRHFRGVRKSYQESVGLPGVNTMPALALVFHDLSRRFHAGERTFELYQAMNNCE